MKTKRKEFFSNNTATVNTRFWLHHKIYWNLATHIVEAGYREEKSERHWKSLAWRSWRGSRRFLNRIKVVQMTAATMNQSPYEYMDGGRSLPFGTKQGKTSEHNRFTYLRRRNAVERVSTCRLNPTWYLVSQLFGLQCKGKAGKLQLAQWTLQICISKESKWLHVSHVCRLKLHKDKNISYKASRKDGHSKNGG